MGVEMFQCKKKKKKGVLPGSTVIGQDISFSQKITICLMVSSIWTQFKKLQNRRSRYFNYKNKPAKTTNLHQKINVVKLN